MLGYCSFRADPDGITACFYNTLGERVPSVRKCICVNQERAFVPFARMATNCLRKFRVPARFVFAPKFRFGTWRRAFLEA